MKVQDIKNEEDIGRFIVGCLNDYRDGVSSKKETANNTADLITYIVTLDRQKRGKLLVETAMRAHLALPTNDEQMKWFDDGTDHKLSGDFMERLYKAIDVI